MPYARDPLHPLDALYQACRAYPGGIRGLARKRQCNEATLYKKLEWRNETHRLSYEEASEILDDLQAAGVSSWDATLHALCHRHGGVFVRLPEVGEKGAGAALQEHILRVVKEHGDVAAVLSQALADDGDIDSKEFAAFETQNAELLAAIAALGELVRSVHQAARKAGRVR